MKFSSFASAILALLLAASPSLGMANLPPDTSSQDLTRDVLREINRVRTDPQGYAAYLETLRPLYRPGGMLEFGQGKMRVQTHEGVAALNEAIRCLQRAQPLPPLTFCAGLASSARDHAQEQGRTGKIGHDSRGGSSPFDRMSRYGAWCNEAGENIAYGPLSARQIVMNLVVDDGVPGRGHRTNVLKSTFGVAGVGIGEHPRYGSVCVIDFATDFVAR